MKSTMNKERKCSFSMVSVNDNAKIFLLSVDKTFCRIDISYLRHHFLIIATQDMTIITKV